ncbi:MAG: SGNH/GDSL hydrolase family protein [Ilumatobacter sp.]|nr:MAG: SGNH/GDSL hydrolase family protein [Ilumatobacter sp.]
MAMPGTLHTLGLTTGPRRRGRHPTRSFALAILTAAVVIVACGSDDTATVEPSATDVTTTSRDTTTTTPTTTTVPERLDDPLSVVFIGDSTGRIVAEGLAEVAASEGSIELAIATRNGCGLMTTGDLLNPMSGQWEPVPVGCIEQIERIIPTVVAERQPDVVLAMVSSWDVSERRWADGVESAPVDPLHQERLGADYARLAERLLDTGASEVIWLLQPTPNGFWQGSGEGQDDDRWQEASRDVVRALADVDPRADVLDLVGWMGDEGLLDDVDTRPDGIHFSPDAARDVGRWIRAELLARTASG